MLVAVVLVVAQAASAEVVTGSYIGDGTSPRVIVVAQPGFAPAGVLIKGAGATYAILRTQTMAGTLAKPILGQSSPQSDLVLSLDPNGFTVGAAAPVNAMGIRYDWVAFSAEPGESHFGTYVGDGVADREIAGLGFQPDVVIVTTEAPENSRVRTLTAPPGRSYDFGSLETTTSIRSFTADGFTIGPGAAVNAPGVRFHFVAWKQVAGKVQAGSYTGDAVDGRIVGNLGLDAGYVFIQGVNTGAVHRGNAPAGTDESQTFTNLSNQPNLIQSFGPGSFEVGTDSRVNTLGRTYHYVAYAALNANVCAGGVCDGGACCTADAGDASEPPDAGSAMDGGGGDADGGGDPDGGGPDGGGPDGGDADGGCCAIAPTPPEDPREFQIGCGCQSTGDTLWPLLVTLVIRGGVRRRSAERRAPAAWR